MALVILDTPTFYDSAHGDLVYVVNESSLYSSTNFKYVCDIYIGGVYTARLKTFPNPSSHYGIFNIGNIVRNYVDSNLNPTLGGVYVQRFDNHRAKIQCKFGYEYGVPLVLTTNVTNDSERWFYNSYDKRLLVNQSSVLTNVQSEIASNRPIVNKALYPSTPTAVANSIMMPFFYGTPCPTTNSNYIKIRLQKKLLNDTIVSYTDVGALNPIIGSPEGYLYQLDVCPGAINNIFNASGQGYPIDANVKSYYVRIVYMGDDCDPALNTTLYQFDMYCEPRYDINTLVWLNQYGGYDSFDFSKVSRRGYDLDKKSFKKLGYTISSAGLYQTWTGYTKNDDVVTYSSKFKERLLLNSDLINEATYTWLNELIISSSVYIQTYSGLLIPITIKDTTYDFKKLNTDRNFNFSLNIEYGDLLNTQYR